MKTLTVTGAKKQLKDKGWTYRSAAPELHVGFEHLAKVLTNRRISRALLQRIAELPENPNPKAA